MTAEGMKMAVVPEAARATPEDIRAYLMDCRIPKSEAEHWAARRITELESLLSAAPLEGQGAVASLLPTEGQDAAVVAGLIVKRIRARYESVKTTTYNPGTPAEAMKDGELHGLNTALAIAMVIEEEAAHQPPVSPAEQVELDPVFPAAVKAMLDRFDRTKGKGGYPSANEREAMRRCLAALPTPPAEGSGR